MRVPMWVPMRVLTPVLIAASFAAFAADNSSDRNADTFSEDVLQSLNALEQPEFLPVDKAFVLTAELTDANAVLARWTMPDGYYLYRHAGQEERQVDRWGRLGQTLEPQLDLRQGDLPIQDEHVFLGRPGDHPRCRRHASVDVVQEQPCELGPAL